MERRRRCRRTGARSAEGRWSAAVSTPRATSSRRSSPASTRPTSTRSGEESSSNALPKYNYADLMTETHLMTGRRRQNRHRRQRRQRQEVQIGLLLDWSTCSFICYYCYLRLQAQIGRDHGLGEAQRFRLQSSFAQRFYLDGQDNIITCCGE